MSKFLGPIHFWLYNKIQLQEELIRAIANEADAHNWSDAAALSKEVCRDDSRPLDEIIDEGNIHGWLQSHIHDAEGRYAALVTAIVSADASRMDVLKQAAYDFGTRHAAEADATAFDVYHVLDSSLLNGMPCDRINIVTVQENDHFAWEQAEDIHASYWIEANGDPANYYTLRNEVTRGIISGAGFVLETPDENHYEIKKAV